MLDDYYDIEDWIKQALCILQHQEKLNILKTAQEFYVLM
jgi:hypothetical protein